MLQQVLCITLPLFATLALAQVPHFGKCPNVPAQRTLDVNKYLGEWYEIRRFPTLFEEGNCIKARYSLLSNGNVQVDNRALVDGKESQALGDAHIPDPVNEPAVLAVKFSSLSPAAEYKVIDTDYTTHSLVFSCGGFLGIAHAEFAWILSRTPTMDPALVQSLENKLASHGVDVSSFISTNHTGCSYTKDPLVGLNIG